MSWREGASCDVVARIKRGCGYYVLVPILYQSIFSRQFVFLGIIPYSMFRQNFWNIKYSATIIHNFVQYSRAKDEPPNWSLNSFSIPASFKDFYPSVLAIRLVNRRAQNHHFRRILEGKVIFGGVIGVFYGV